MIIHDTSGPVYILAYPDGGFAALDGSSGGYPYKVKEWYRAEFWTDPNRMTKYKEMFKKENFSVHQVIPNFIPE